MKTFRRKTKLEPKWNCLHSFVLLKAFLAKNTFLLTLNHSDLREGWGVQRGCQRRFLLHFFATAESIPAFSCFPNNLKTLRSICCTNVRDRCVHIIASQWIWIFCDSFPLPPPLLKKWPCSTELDRKILEEKVCMGNASPSRFFRINSLYAIISIKKNSQFQKGNGILETCDNRQHRNCCTFLEMEEIWRELDFHQASADFFGVSECNLVNLRCDFLQ